MPSGMSDAVADNALDALWTTLPDPMYLDLLTNAPSDDNGGDETSWGQGRASVATAAWGSASGRLKDVTVVMPPNASGGTITVVAFAFYSASTAGTYLGGGPIPDDVLDVPDGDTPAVTATLASPPPS